MVNNNYGFGRALILSLWNPKNNHESAINDIKYAIELKPNNHNFVYEYGRILHRAGYTFKALEQYQIITNHVLMCI